MPRCSPIHYPDEEREAARPLRQTPCYDRMKKLGAVFGSVFGWERPNWFAPEGYELTEADLDKPETSSTTTTPTCRARRSAKVVVPSLQLLRACWQ
jgi:glycine cleavage system aminomethyltransferase T